VGLISDVNVSFLIGTTFPLLRSQNAAHLPSAGGAQSMRQRSLGDFARKVGDVACPFPEATHVSDFGT
jgi:hypothetical protein